MKKLFFLAISLAFSISLFAQKTYVYTDPQKSIQQAEENFHDQYYGVALHQFENIIASNKQLPSLIKMKAKFYEALCYQELESAESEKIWYAFLDEFPVSDYSNRAHFHLGNFYFKNKEYEKSIQEYDLVDAKLNPDQQQELTFNQGYSQFFKKNYTQAEYHFQSLIQDENSPYYSDANYYFGFINYKADKYENALKAFQKIKEHEKYRKIVPYYIVNIYAQLGQADQVVNEGEKFLQEPNLAYKNDIKYLIGQSLFKEKKYEEALPMLKSYVENSDKVRKEDVYQLAFTEYLLHKYDDASKNFQQLSSISDTLGQNASYHLGDCYLNSNEKTKALNAFTVASKQDFNLKIKENAAFQTAKLSAELKQKNAIDLLQQFIKMYPSSSNNAEAKEILTDVYLNASNYDEALKAMDNITDKSNKIKKAYQQTAYIKAIDLYNNQKYSEATQYFEKSNTYPVDNEIYKMSTFWMGEIAYQTKNYTQAIALMSQYLNTSSSSKTISSEASNYNALYTLGYAYLKLEKYDQAIAQFQAINNIYNNAPAKYRTDVNIVKINTDAQVRLADCFFKMTDYTSATTFYDNVRNQNGSDAPYATYQMALIQGLSNRNADKISTLNQMLVQYPKSKYNDDAIYELGKTYNETDRNTEAIPYFQKLITEYPSSPLLLSAKNRLALIYINQNDNNKALHLYQEVISQNTKSKESNEALEGIKNIYIQKNDPNGYINYLSTQSGINISESAKDTLLFTNAENIYMTGNCALAISTLDEYLNQYPNGVYNMTARYYRGDCAYKEKDFGKAYNDMSYIADHEDNIFTEKALLIAAKIAYYERKDYQKSFDYFQKLVKNSNYKENVQPATKGLMESAFQLKRYDETIEIANQLLNTTEPSKDELTLIYFYLGQCYYAKNEKTIASGNYKRMENYVKNAYTAEGQYMLAKIMYENQEYDTAKEQCMKVNNQYNDYEYWVVKSYILMADIATAQKEYFQAKATLQSIIEGYDGEAQIKEECLTKLDNISKLEAESTKIETAPKDTIIEMPTTPNE